MAPDTMDYQKSMIGQKGFGKRYKILGNTVSAKIPKDFLYKILTLIRSLEQTANKIFVDSGSIEQAKNEVDSILSLFISNLESRINDPYDIFCIKYKLNPDDNYSKVIFSECFLGETTLEDYANVLKNEGINFSHNDLMVVLHNQLKKEEIWFFNKFLFKKPVENEEPVIYQELGETSFMKVPVIMKNELENLLFILEQEARKMDKEMAVIKLKSMIDNYFS